MKARTKGFLADELISHDSEKFDYISELHGYLWQFIRCQIPGASGKIDDYIDIALEKSKKQIHENSDARVDSLD